MVEYPHGGGRIDCFKCGQSWHAFPIPGGVLMRKFSNQHRRPERHMKVSSDVKHPDNSSEIIRQTTNQKVIV